MGLTPLAIAGAASALLVIVIGADVSMNRNYVLEVDDGETWLLLAEYPYRYEERFARPYPGGGIIEANASDTLHFRLRIDNSYRWSYQDEYVVYAGGREFARGPVDVPAMTERTVTFDLNASQLMGRTNFAAPFPKDASGLLSGSIEVHIERQTLYGTVTIREVSK